MNFNTKSIEININKIISSMKSNICIEENSDIDISLSTSIHAFPFKREGTDISPFIISALMAAVTLGLLHSTSPYKRQLVICILF